MPIHKFYVTCDISWYYLKSLPLNSGLEIMISQRNTNELNIDNKRWVGTFYKFSRLFKDGSIDSRPFSHDYDDHDNDNDILFVSRLFKDGSIYSRSTALSLLPSRLARGQCCYSTRLRGLLMMVMLIVMVALMVIMVVLIMKNKLWWWCWLLWQLQLARFKRYSIAILFEKKLLLCSQPN